MTNSSTVVSLRQPNTPEANKSLRENCPNKPSHLTGALDSVSEREPVQVDECAPCR